MTAPPTTNESASGSPSMALTPPSAPPSSTDASTAPSLRASSATIQFTTVKRLFEEIGHAAGDLLTVQGMADVRAHRATLTVQNVSGPKFAEIETERERRWGRFRFRRYLARAETLIITIPTAIHEGLHLGIWDVIRDEIVRMGLRDEWRSMGSVTLRATLGHPGGDGGEGDSTGALRSQRRGRLA